MAQRHTIIGIHVAHHVDACQGDSYKQQCEERVRAADAERARVWAKPGRSDGELNRANSQFAEANQDLQEHLDGRVPSPVRPSRGPAR